MPENWLMPPDPLWTWAVFAFFVMVAVIQLFYFWFYFRRAAFFSPGRKPGYDGPVSVVVCARNEYHNLEKNLPLLLSQDYPDFEVVVVDDGSDDDTDLLLQQMKARHPHLKVVPLRENVNFFKGKKLALSVGIKSAAHEVLLLTDADCRPASPHWLLRMVDNYGDGTGIVLGYGAYEKHPGLLNRLIRFDTFFIALQYMGMALAGRAYMGVGRNLSYKRALFYAVKGFTSHYKIMSGDDDLFVNQVATSENVAVEMNPQSHTLSFPKTSWRAWYRQKRRHMSTSVHYKPSHKRRLGLFSFTHLAFYPLLAAILAGAAQSLFGLVAVGLFLVRSASLLILLSGFARRLQEKGLLPFSLLHDLVHPLINFIFVVSSMFSANKAWK
jgi:glycosyltransferase involved in cell wall biosynthesis